MLGLILVLFLTPNAEAQTKARGTDIYEQEAGESTTKSVTGKIRVVREVSDEVEVFFRGRQNPRRLHPAPWSAALWHHA
jgi:hypothetical protein